jgi:DNA-binding response OmpR family regulator
MPNLVTDVAGARTTSLGEQRPAVLIIDDDPAVLHSLQTVLEAHDFRVLTARNGHHGLQVFRDRSPAVVVTDIMMPEQDGIGAMLQMRRERRDVKIIAMSGSGYFDGWDYLAVAEQLGADAVFRKTLDTDPLIHLLERLLPLAS